MCGAVLLSGLGVCSRGGCGECFGLKVVVAWGEEDDEEEGEE